MIIKLGQKITDRIGHKVTVDDPEYWGLACVVTDEMAEVALAMKVRKPASAQEIAGRNAVNLAKADRRIAAGDERDRSAGV
ncbi:MAG: hypothetical protein V8R14_00260 [Clostridia bacterium]